MHLIELQRSVADLKACPDNQKDDYAMLDQPKRHTTLVKYLAVQRRYRELYDKKRLRHDDVIIQLCKEFFIAHPNTVYKILATQCNPDQNGDSKK